jgi:hypothetical protein
MIFYSQQLNNRIINKKYYLSLIQQKDLNLLIIKKLITWIAQKILKTKII